MPSTRVRRGGPNHQRCTGDKAQERSPHRAAQSTLPSPSNPRPLHPICDPHSQCCPANTALQQQLTQRGPRQECPCLLGGCHWVAWTLPMPKKDHFRERFCSGFVISAVTWQSTLAGTRECSAPVTPCPTLSLPLASNPAWSKHLRSPDLQPSLGTNLFLSGKNSSWAFYHINRPCFCPQDSGSSVTPAVFNFQGNSVLGKKQSQHSQPLPSACSILHQSSRSVNQLLGEKHNWKPWAGTQARDCRKQRGLMFALFTYVAAPVSARVPFCGGVISCSWLPLAPSCWLHFLLGAISLACTKKPPLTSLPGCPPCPASETPPACRGNS